MIDFGYEDRLLDRIALRRAVETLPARERSAVIRRVQGFHYREVGNHLGVSADRARQLELRGLSLLRRPRARLFETGFNKAQFITHMSKQVAKPLATPAIAQARLDHPLEDEMAAELAAIARRDYEEQLRPQRVTVDTGFTTYHFDVVPSPPYQYVSPALMAAVEKAELDRDIALLVKHITEQHMQWERAGNRAARVNLEGALKAAIDGATARHHAIVRARLFRK